MRYLFPLAVLIFAISATESNAQTKKSPPQKAAVSLSKQLPQEEVFMMPPSMQRLTIKSDSITLKHFVNLVKEQVPGFNIVLSERAQETILPKLSVADVRAKQVVDLLRAAKPETLRITGSENLYYIDYFEKKKHVEPRMLTVPISVGDLFLGVMKIDQKTLTSAIQEGLMISRAKPENTKIQLHEKTGLLFVRGEPKTIELVQGIINELRVGQKRKSALLPFGFPEK